MTKSYEPCTYRVSAKAAIKGQRGLLLVKEDSDRWDLPGGGIEHLEEPEDALCREIEEELGAKVASVETDKVQAWATYDHPADRPLLFLVYPTRIEAEVTALPNPDITARYFTSEELQNAAIELHLEKFRQKLAQLASD